MMTTTINGRTLEEIKLGLECCCPKWESSRWVTCRDECPFRNEHAFCKNVLMACTLALLCRFERERDEARNDLDTLSYANTELHSAYEAMKRERDAAVENLPHLCILCKFQPTDFKEKLHAKCTTCIKQRNWEWMGPQEVN